MKTISTTVTWGDVAGYFGLLAFCAAAFAVRYSDIKERMKARSGDDGSRIAMGFVGVIYIFFVGIGLILLWQAAR